MLCPRQWSFIFAYSVDQYSLKNYGHYEHGDKLRELLYKYGKINAAMICSF